MNPLQIRLVSFNLFNQRIYINISSVISFSS